MQLICRVMVNGIASATRALIKNLVEIGAAANETRGMLLAVHWLTSSGPCAPTPCVGCFLFQPFCDSQGGLTSLISWCSIH